MEALLLAVPALPVRARCGGGSSEGDAVSADEQQLDRLLAGVRTGDRRAARQIFEILLDGWQANDERVDGVLDALALEAANGSVDVASTLLAAVHQLGLARPAISRLILDPATIDEVAQSTLVQVERNITRFESRSKFRTWLYSIARNEALMRLRRDANRPEPSEQLDTMATAGARMSSVIATRATVRQALEQLPEPYRQTMLLRVDDGLDYAEIAAALEVPVGTVRSRLAKARELLSDQLTPP